MSINWEMVAAVGQVAGAMATFLAVLVSLHLSRTSRRPDLRLKVGERLIIGSGPDMPALLMFSVVNMGDRVAHVRSVGWTTGWLPFGPQFLKKRNAIQLIGSVRLGDTPPFQLSPAEEKSAYSRMSDVLAHSRARRSEPIFTRDFPAFGRRATRCRAWVSTAEGYTFKVALEPKLKDALVKAEQEALLQPS